MARKQSYDGLDLFRVLQLMQPRPLHSGLPARPLVATPEGADWRDRPPYPEKPDEDTDDLNALFEARQVHSLYQQFWPTIPKKLFRRLVKRGYVQEADNCYWISDEGIRAVLHRNAQMRESFETRNPRGRPLWSKARTYKQRRERAAIYQLKHQDPEDPIPIPRYLQTFGLSRKTRKRLMHRFGRKKKEPEPEERPIGRRIGWLGGIKQRWIERKHSASLP